MATTTKMTADQVRAKFDELMPTLNELAVHDPAIIEGYPIGGANKGKCAMAVEVNKKGWRTVKTTTDKRGRWCNPKKSTYSQTGTCWVVSGDMVQKDYAWLSIDLPGIYLTAANTVVTTVLASPFSSPYVRNQAGVSYGTYYEADSQEVLDAWLEWTKGLQDASRLMASILAYPEIMATKLNKLPA